MTKEKIQKNKTAAITQKKKVITQRPNIPKSIGVKKNDNERSNLNDKRKK